MSNQHIFHDVTPALLERTIARISGKAGLSLALDDDGRGGTATGPTPLGEVAVRFDYAPEATQLTLTVVRKPALVPVAMLWSQFAGALDAARTEAT